MKKIQALQETTDHPITHKSIYAVLAGLWIILFPTQASASLRPEL